MGRQRASAQAAPTAMLGGMKILVKWLLCAAALLGVAYVYSGVQVQSFGSAMIAALVIGLLNTIIRPILVILTLPVTIITVGLFLLVVNGIMLSLVAWMLPGFDITGFWDAVWGALIVSIVSGIGSAIFGPRGTIQVTIDRK